MDSAPYLLDGGLLIYNPKTDQYLKVLPTIREDGYADYIFTAYNTKALKDRLNDLQNLLLADPRYRSSVPQSITKLPQDDPTTRQKAIKDMQEWADILLSQVNELFKHDDNDDDAKIIIRQDSPDPVLRQVLFVCPPSCCLHLLPKRVLVLYNSQTDRPNNRQAVGLPRPSQGWVPKQQLPRKPRNRT